MTVGEWQERLQDNFLGGGESSLQLERFRTNERAIGDYVLGKFHGNRILTNSFVTFFAETLELALRQFSQPIKDPKPSNFATTLIEFGVLLRRLRAADSLLYTGYPLSGYALLRDVRDQCFFINAVMDGTTTYRRLDGLYDSLASGSIGSLSAADEKKRLNYIKNEENRILKLKMCLDAPSQIVKESFDIWCNLFHAEVHGSRLTTATEFRAFVTGQEGFPIFPKGDETAIAMYMNRTSEIQWFVSRSLPCLQFFPSGFGEEWERRWRILDESFRYMVRGLNKDVSVAVEAIADSRFTLTPADRYQGG